MTYFGRTKELQLLARLKQKDSASLVCMLGRRRIGKSRLIQEFGTSYKHFFEMQGLGPEEKATNQDQLDHFANKLSLHFQTRKDHFEDWSTALTRLAELSVKGERLILIDEISWLAKEDPLFTARLKDIWDTQFKKNPKLILVLCGSVSPWIEKNILLNTNFVGRVSLQINLESLLLPDINSMIKAKGIQCSSLEKMLMLSVTGGVPKYIEEFVKTESIEQNIIRLCYDRYGFLFNEYEKIFTEVLGRKSQTYEKIIRECLSNKLSISDLAQKTGVALDGELSENVHNLEISGFLARDYFYNPNGTTSKLSQLRVKDNYTRFYLKNILPLKDKINNGHQISSLKEIKNFDAILGYQFENLILANRNELYPQLNLTPAQIISSAPHFQRANTKNKGSCQIDLLIHTNLDVFYLCEFKCKKLIDKQIIEEVKKKVAVLALSKRTVLKPVLVYEGEIYPSHQEEIEDYFYKTIPLSNLL